MNKYQINKNLDILLKELKNRSMPLTSLHSFCEQTFNPKPSNSEITSCIIELLNKGFISNIHNNEYSITISGRLFVGFEEEEKKKQDDKDTDDKKLILHYVYYTIATMALFVALFKNCSDSNNCNCCKTKNSNCHNIKK